MVKVLFVCTGNICRSPTAEGVFRHIVDKSGLSAAITIDSAGTHGYHTGEPPDERSQEAAAARGYDLSPQRARRVRQDDFETFDLILAMDRGHLAELNALCPPHHAAKVQLFLDYAAGVTKKDVPDPYYGGYTGFEHVLDLIESGAEGLLASLRDTRAVS